MLAHQIKAAAITQMAFCPPFAAGLFGIAQRQNDHVGIFCGFNCFGNQLAVSHRIGKLDLITPPIVIFGDLHALRKNDICVLASLGLDTV